MCKNRVIYGFWNTSWVLINMAPRNRGDVTLVFPDRSLHAPDTSESCHITTHRTKHTPCELYFGTWFVPFIRGRIREMPRCCSLQPCLFKIILLCPLQALAESVNGRCSSVVRALYAVVHRETRDRNSVGFASVRNPQCPGGKKNRLPDEF